MHDITLFGHSNRNTARSHTHLRGLFAAGAALALFVTACAMPDDDRVEEMGDQGEVIMADEAGIETLAELHPDPDTVVRFTKEPSLGLDDGFAVGVTVIGPDDGIAYERLLSDHAATALELFLALAPTDSQVPEELRIAHRGETQAQGRDERVRELKLDIDKALYPFSSSVCDSYSSFQSFVSAVWAGQPSSGAREQFTDSSTGGHFLAPNSADAGYLTACNRDSNRVDSKYVLVCSRYRYATSGDTNWVCDNVWLDDGMRVAKSWGCESTGSYCKERYFQVSATQPNPASTRSYLGIVQLHYIF